MQIKTAVRCQRASDGLGKTGRLESLLTPHDHVWLSYEIEIRICLHARLASGPGAILRPMLTTQPPQNVVSQWVLVARG
jgi:hypothetical protein